MIGVKHLCRTPIGQEIDAAIICEPEENEVCLEQRGVVWARVIIRGRMAHGAMPEAGRNPIEAVGELIRRCRTLEARLRRLCRPTRHLKPATVTPTIVRAPARGVPQSNVIPAGAEVVIDVRLTPGPDADTIAAAIDRLCKDTMKACRDISIQWTPINGFRLPTLVPRREPLVQAVVDGVKQATGRPARFGGVPGSTDGTILRMERGIPIVTLGPGKRLIPHQADEYVGVDELVAAARIYVASALNFLK